MVWQLSSIQAPPPAPAAPLPPQETDVSLFERLRAAVNADQVNLVLDFARLRQGDSPVLFQADGNTWFIGTAAAVIAAALAVGWQLAAAALVAGIVLHLTVARKYVDRRIERRVRTNAFKDIAEWRKLWRFGGVTLVRSDGAAPAECRAPDGNWFDFARRLPPLAAANLSHDPPNA